MLSHLEKMIILLGARLNHSTPKKGGYVRKSYEQRQDRRFVPGNIHPQDYHAGGTPDEGGNDWRYRSDHHDDCGSFVGEPFS